MLVSSKRGSFQVFVLTGITFPNHRVEASRAGNSCGRPPVRELVRKTPEKSWLPSVSAQQSTVKNANQVLLGTQ